MLRLLLPVFAVLVAPLLPQDVLAGLGRERLDAYLADFRTVRASFEQTRYDEAGSPQEIASGSMMLERPGKFRWDYVTPYEQTIVADGEKVWIYDKDLEQITVKNLTGAIGSTPSLLLGGEVDLDSEFIIEESGERSGLEWIELTPKGEESEYSRIGLGFDAAGLRVMELADGFGGTTRIRFSNEERNVDLDASLFRFEPPPGVDVIQAGDPPAP